MARYAALLLLLLCAGCSSPERWQRREFTPTIPPASERNPPSRFAATMRLTMLASALVKTDRGGGTGFLFRRDGDVGYLATNAHVVSGSENVHVVFWDFTRQRISLRASVAAIDRETDLAILRVRARGLPAPVDSRSPLDPEDRASRGRHVYFWGCYPGVPRDEIGAPHPLAEEQNPDIRRRPKLRHGRLLRTRVGQRLGFAVGRDSHDRQSIFGPGDSGAAVCDTDGALIGIAYGRLRTPELGPSLPPEIRDLPGMPRPRVELPQMLFLVPAAALDRLARSLDDS